MAEGVCGYAVFGGGVVCGEGDGAKGESADVCSGSGGASEFSVGGMPAPCQLYFILFLTDCCWFVISVCVCALRQPVSFWGVLFLFLCGCLNGEGSDREDTESFDSWQVGVNDVFRLVLDFREMARIFGLAQSWQKYNVTPTGGVLQLRYAGEQIERSREYSHESSRRSVQSQNEAVQDYYTGK